MNLRPSLIGRAVLGLSAWNVGISSVIIPTVAPNYKHPVFQRDSLALYPLASMPICFSGMTTFTSKMNAVSSYTNDTQASYSLPIGAGIYYDAESALKTKISARYTKMVRWDVFHEYVMPMVQGCPVSIVNAALRSACTEFCEKSFIWKQSSVKNDIKAGWYLYTFAPPLYAKVVTPFRVSVEGREVLPTDIETLESFSPDWKEVTARTPDYYFLESHDTIRLIGQPTEDLPEALTADVVLKPARDADGCPSFLFQDWAEAIAAGALSKLHAMANQIWAVPELVSYYDKTFKAGISRAKSKSAKSWQQESKVMLPVDFYNKKVVY